VGDRALCFRVAHVVRASNSVGMMELELGSQESCVPLKFDRSQTGQLEGPPFGVPFSH